MISSWKKTCGERWGNKSRSRRKREHWGTRRRHVVVIASSPSRRLLRLKRWWQRSGDAVRPRFQATSWSVWPTSTSPPLQRRIGDVEGNDCRIDPLSNSTVNILPLILFHDIMMSPYIHRVSPRVKWVFLQLFFLCCVVYANGTQPGSYVSTNREYGIFNLLLDLLKLLVAATFQWTTCHGSTTWSDRHTCYMHLLTIIDRGANPFQW